MEDRLPIMITSYQESLLVPFVTGEDLKALGIPEKKRSAIIADIIEKQLRGELLKREDALTAAIQFSISEGINVTAGKINQLLEVGGFSRYSSRLENISLLSERQEDGYKVKKYITKPLKQYDKDTPLAEIEHDINSGNFPYLVRHLFKNQISTDKVKQLLLNQFANLLQLEFFVKEFHQGETILNVGTTKSPVHKAIEIEREFHGKTTTFVVYNGYQGVKDHTGAGLIHIGEQRTADLKRDFRRPEETVEQMTKRFFEEAVMHVTGTATLEIPSDYDPEKISLLIGKLKNSQDAHAIVVCNKSAAKPSVITTIFAKNGKEMRKNIINYLRRLKEKSNFTSAQISPIVENCNIYLSNINQPTLSIESLERTDGQTKPPEEKTVQKISENKDNFKNMRNLLGKSGMGSLIKDFQKALSESGKNDIEITADCMAFIEKLKKEKMPPHEALKKLTEFFIDSQNPNISAAE